MDNENAIADCDQRRSDRFATGLPVCVDGAPGETRNVSARGIYFETVAEQRVGSLVNISVEYTLQGRRQRLLCEGKVVRVEPRGDRIGVAARLLAPMFDEERSATPA